MGAIIRAVMRSIIIIWPWTILAMLIYTTIYLWIKLDSESGTIPYFHWGEFDVDDTTDRARLIIRTMLTGAQIPQVLLPYLTLRALDNFINDKPPEGWKEKLFPEQQSTLWNITHADKFCQAIVFVANVANFWANLSPGSFDSSGETLVWECFSGFYLRSTSRSAQW